MLKKGLKFFLVSRGGATLVGVCSFWIMFYFISEDYLLQWYPGAPEMTLIFVKLSVF